MDQDIYTTHTEDSLLQAHGPYRIHTTSFSLSKAQKPEVIKASEPILLSKIELHGRAVTTREKQLDHYLAAS